MCIFLELDFLILRNDFSALEWVRDASALSLGELVRGFSGRQHYRLWN